MSLQGRYVSWLLVGILSIVICIQFIGANKAEHRAEQLEALAKDVDAQLQSFKQASAEREALAESRYQASLQESANLRSILVKGSQARPVIPPQSLEEAIRTHPDLPKGDDSQKSTQAAQNACQPFIYKGEPLVIQQFQVKVCDQQPMVQAEAAVALGDEKALVDKLQTNLAELMAKEVLQEKDLAAYKAAEQSWKKAAKKSRFKKAVGVIEKAAIFAGGIYLGHATH